MPKYVTCITKYTKVKKFANKLSIEGLLVKNKSQVL